MTGYLGVDVGGTKVALRVEGAGGAVDESSFAWPPASDPALDLALLAYHVATVRATWTEPIVAVGIAMPATVDSEGCVVTWPGRPSWRGLDLATALADLFPGARVRWADDGDLAAVAEAGAAGCADLVYLGVGTGIGGGIVLGGRSVPGSNRGSSEIGHVIVDRSGARCDCGRQGCVQAIASGPATLRRAGAARGAEVTFAEFVRGVSDSRLWAVSALEESCVALATTVVNLTELLRPELVVVGGGFAAAVPDLIDRVNSHAEGLARAGHPPAPVRRAAFGGLSSLYGAVRLARDLPEPVDPPDPPDQPAATGQVPTVATKARAASR